MLIDDALQDARLEAFDSLRPIFCTRHLRPSLVIFMGVVVRNYRVVLQPRQIAAWIYSYLNMVHGLWYSFFTLQSSTADTPLLIST